MAKEPSQQQIGLLLRELIPTLMKSSPGYVLRVMQHRELAMTQLVALWYLHRTGTDSLGMPCTYPNLSLTTTSPT